MRKNELFLEEKLSGHSYYNSPYESHDECDNCNGARCEQCKRIYFVVEWQYNKEYTDDENNIVIPNEIHYSGYDKVKAMETFNQQFFDMCVNDYITYAEIRKDILFNEIKIIVNKESIYDSININIFEDNMKAVIEAIEDDSDKSIHTIREKYLYVFKKDGDIFINYIKLSDENIATLKSLIK